MVPKSSSTLLLMQESSDVNAAQSSHTDDSPPSKRLRDVPSRHRLCRRCSRIDVDGVLSRKHKTYVGQHVKRLGPMSTWAIGSCRLCDLLATTLSPEDRRHADTVYTLRSFSSTRSRAMGLNSIDTGMMRLHPGGTLIIPQRPGAAWVRILSPDQIDFEIIKNWLGLCYEMHTETCGLKTNSPVPSMKLIDCETRHIVPAADHPYVCLSYVCGADARPTDWSGSLPQELPATIEDSISVTRKLGFRYLWIDQFCIDQNDKAQLAAQLLTMDSIYQNSDLTIIAAAGQDPTYGLPGVGKRHRVQQSYAQIRKYFFASPLNSPRHVIEDSTWITRAWTYQEGILSRRRLVFTDEQVYYECYGMYCCEALDLPLRGMHIKSRQRFKSTFRDAAKFPRGVGQTPWEVLRRIEEYSQKSLTNPSDILNGVLGILRAFEESVYKIRHCLGVPILPEPSRRAHPPSESGETASSWNPITGLFAALCWQTSNPTSRRIGFPSWSWTGWSAAVRWDVRDLEIIRTDPNIDVSFEVDNVVILYDVFQNCYADLERSLALSRYINISAWVSKIRMMEYSRREGTYTARIDEEDGGYLHWRFRPTTMKHLSRKLSYIGIHMGYQVIDKEDPFSCRTGPALLVFARLETGLERVAFDWVDQMNYTSFTADGTERDNEYLWRNPMHAHWPKLVKSWQQVRLG